MICPCKLYVLSNPHMRSLAYRVNGYVEQVLKIHNSNYAPLSVGWLGTVFWLRMWKTSLCSRPHRHTHIMKYGRFHFLHFVSGNLHILVQWDISWQPSRAVCLSKTRVFNGELSQTKYLSIVRYSEIKSVNPWKFLISTIVGKTQLLTFLTLNSTALVSDT